jgi:hypothetical protein
MAATGKASTVSMTNGVISNCLYGMSSTGDNSRQDNHLDFDGVTITDTTFTNNGIKGLYFEKINNAVLTNVTVTDTAGAGMSVPAQNGVGMQFNLKYGAYTAITVNNPTLTGNGVVGSNGIGLMVAARNDGGVYSVKPASLAAFTLSGGSISGSPTNVSVQGAITLANASLSGTVIGSSGTPCADLVGLVLETSNAGTLALGNVSFSSALPLYTANKSTASTINATAALIGGTAGSSLTVTQGLAAADKVLDSVDASFFGAVVLKSGNVYVTTNSFFAPFTSAASVQRGVSAASAGDTVNVGAGTYTDNVVVDKRITLDGAGKSSSGTIVLAADTTLPAIKVTGSGTDSSNKLTVSNVRLVGVSQTGGSDGIDIEPASSSAFIAVDNVDVSNHGTAVHYRIGSISNVSVTRNSWPRSLAMEISAMGLPRIGSAMERHAWANISTPFSDGTNPARICTSATRR